MGDLQIRAVMVDLQKPSSSARSAGVASSREGLASAMPNSLGCADQKWVSGFTTWKSISQLQFRFPVSGYLRGPWRTVICISSVQ